MPNANIASRLERWAAERPLAPAIIEGRRRITFGALEQESARLAAGLEVLGIGRGDRAVLMVPPSVEMVALAFALFRCGAVPVFVDPGVGWRHLRTCLRQAKPDAFMGSPLAHAGCWLGRWARGPLKARVVARGWFPGAVGLAALRRGIAGLRAPERPRPHEPAAILYTSGSTGSPKGAVYTHEMLGAQADALRELFDIKPGEASVPTFPLFALFDVALGLTAVLPRMDFSRPAKADPREILSAIERHGASQLFGSPALLNRVGRFAEPRGLKLPSLKRVLCAGAPVPAKTRQCFERLLTGSAQVHTPYGATEALPVATIASAELSATAQATASGLGVCVGRPAPGVEVAIVPILDGPIARWSGSLRRPAGEVGEIAVRGPVVSALYYNMSEATASAKIPGEGGAFWHRMGDLGYVDERGRLWFCGRKSQRVETGEATLLTACCEGVFNAHAGVKRSALVGARSGGRVVPVLCVEREDSAQDSAALRRELLELGAHFKASHAVREVLFHPGFPVDARHNAKIRREELAAWAERQLSRR